MVEIISFYTGTCPYLMHPSRSIPWEFYSYILCQKLLFDVRLLSYSVVRKGLMICPALLTQCRNARRLTARHSQGIHFTVANLLRCTAVHWSRKVTMCDVMLGVVFKLLPWGALRGCIVTTVTRCTEVCYELNAMFPLLCCLRFLEALCSHIDLIGWLSEWLGTLLLRNSIKFGPILCCPLLSNHCKAETNLVVCFSVNVEACYYEILWCSDYRHSDPVMVPGSVE